ncbi:hypothetical protein MP638_006756 [Amoeboaphelidium occidentale]|nr:hypothetical protein MP638_006756 [Amoeboaphelidium occidentale]
MPRRPRTLHDMLRCKSCMAGLYLTSLYNLADAGIKPDWSKEPKRNSFIQERNGAEISLPFTLAEIAAWDRKHGIKFRRTKTLVRLTGLPEEEIVRLKNRRCTAKPGEVIQPDESK